MSTRFLTLVGPLVIASTIPAQAVFSVPSQFFTIQAAIDAATPGARVEVAPGTYNEVINFRGKGIAVVAPAGPEVTVINGAGRNDAVVTADSGEPSSARIYGFTLTNGAGKPFPSSYIFDYYGGGVYVGGVGSFLSVEFCWILNNAVSTGTFGGGICAAGTGTRAEAHGCLIAANRAWASGGATLSSGVGTTMLLERCTITNNTATSWAFGYQGGVSMANGGGVDLVNCIVFGNAGYQIRAFGAPYNAGTYANCNYTCVQGGFSGTGNMDLNPLFQQPLSGNFHLQSGSPCIDAGDPLGPLDPDGSRGDLGCFAAVNPQASFSTYGIGCPGIAGVPTLSAAPGSLPRLGQTLEVVLENLPNIATVCVQFMGFAATSLHGMPLPLEMSTYGMPGCFIFTSSFRSGFLLALVPNAHYSLPIPSRPFLLGVNVEMQALVCDPRAGNQLGAILTNAATAHIGN